MALALEPVLHLVPERRLPQRLLDDPVELLPREPPSTRRPAATLS